MRTNSISRFSAVFAAAALAACSENPASTAPDQHIEPPPPATAKLQVDFTNIDVLEDCDGIEGDGDFRFDVSVSVSAGGGGKVYGANQTLGDGGRTSSLGRRTYSVPATNGQQVTIEFVASEIDKNILGQTYNDDRMSNLRRTREHKFNDGAWSSTGPQSIVLGSSGCRVRLNYIANGV